MQHVNNLYWNTERFSTSHSCCFSFLVPCVAVCISVRTFLPVLLSKWLKYKTWNRLNIFSKTSKISLALQWFLRVDCSFFCLTAQIWAFWSWWCQVFVLLWCYYHEPGCRLAELCFGIYQTVPVIFLKDKTAVFCILTIFLYCQFQWKAQNQYSVYPLN